MPPKRPRSELDSEANDNSGDENGRTKKSVRRTATRGKGKRGKNFAKVPVELLYEVSTVSDITRDYC
jgi:hypothetical protein